MSGPNGVPDVPQIDVVAAWKQSRDGTSYIVDVREPDELVEIAVQGAIHVPLGSLPAETSSLPRDRDLLVICRSGVRSAFATKYLLDAGFSGTRNVAGGVIAWSEARLPFEANGTVYNAEDANGEE